MVKLIMAGLVLVFVLAACSGAGGSSSPTPPVTETAAPPVSGTVNVEIAGFAFKPQTITLPQGARIVWTNKDAVRHSAVDNKGGWDSGLLEQGQKYERQFDQAGTFQYHCSLHPAMVGTVVVH